MEKEDYDIKSYFEHVERMCEAASYEPIILARSVPTYQIAGTDLIGSGKVSGALGHRLKDDPSRLFRVKGTCSDSPPRTRLATKVKIAAGIISAFHVSVSHLSS